jgi:hypothetical protein
MILAATHRHPQVGPVQRCEPVSLVIPARNASATLRPCLDAVAPLRQDGGLAEIILVDDGSTDETARIAESYGAVCVKGRGWGPAAARNPTPSSGCCRTCPTPGSAASAAATGS